VPSDVAGLLIEITLFESGYRGGGEPESDVLLTAAKRYRIDAEKLQKAAARKFITKQKKKEK
jgi:hypothetical protein